MKRCPITYEMCENGEKYSRKGLKLLSKSLNELIDFPYTSKEQIELAAHFAFKLSIQGVQPKLSVILNLKTEQFEIVEKNGKFILKPPHNYYEEVPQNEDLTMRLAKIAGIEVPFHAMIYNKDGSLSYIIKRFDRVNRKKIGVEDFTQLLKYTRDTKYDSSMEKVVSVIETHCTFPEIEKLKLFRLVIFNFLTGNEDMHLKNFSLIKHKDKVEMSPAYDLLNTTMITPASKEEMALPLKGKKSNFKRIDLVDYFGIERLGVSKQVLNYELMNFKQAIASWEKLIDISFLSEKKRLQYKELIKARWQRLEIN